MLSVPPVRAPEVIAGFYAMVDAWTPPSPAQALELLLSHQPDTCASLS